MFRAVAIGLFFVVAALPADAAPLALYEPATGKLWISGTQQSGGHVGLFLYSESGQLVMAASPFIVGYPLDIRAESPTYGQWLHMELSISVPTRYVDPFYIGQFVTAGTPASDLSMRYVWFGGGSFDTPLPIQVVSEPATVSLLIAVVPIAVVLIRRAKVNRRST